MKKFILYSLLLVISAITWYTLTRKPTFELDQVHIRISDEDYNKLESFRDTALEKGYLERSEDDFVPAEISYGSEKSTGKVRLKGDWTDHLGSDKWSFRIKLDNQFEDGLQVFSVQNPQARGFLDGYLFHKLLEEEGVLGNEFRFVETIVNGESWGVYCLEEHLTDRLFKKQGRNEGIILKFDDGSYFEASVNEKPIDELIKTADIKLYGEHKKSKTYKTYIKSAKKILQLYQNQDSAMYADFNTEKMAKYYAVCDLATAYHAMGWINIRFFYDFDSELMEPIGYDPYPLLDWGKPYLGKNVPHVNFKKYETEMVIYSALLDSSIVKAYNIQLKRLTTEAYINSFLDKYEDEINFYEKEIQKEYSDYTYDYSFLSSRAAEISKVLE